ncbi:GDSL esterase/lipase lip-4 [Phtheirospermum japonicum]|uniref:GDSL esterase/lipase lip-4 n=1 Tax=Phtheirospermum japonicum TaxID=374723 RepID=A0A830C989_9LAMI|nr:GDSL esterase/lipase lip-4 [Phtheirospermum japonicum]
MSYNQKFMIITPALIIFCLPFVASQCQKKPVIFNFGDSNSDTGGYSVAMGFNFDYPDARAFFHKPTGRLCDGRLVIDFLCENLKAGYLTPYLDSLEPDFTNGVNFAIAGSSTLPKYVPFSLNVQILQFRRFRNRSLEYQSKGFKNLVGEDDFKNALYTIDIGQNDLTGAFNSLSSYPEIIEKIPTFISEIRDAMLAIYQLGGKNFWVHNTGPLGCLPEKLGSRKTNATDFDQYGCIKSMNDGAKAFNAKLSDLCQDLRSQMKSSTIVYVDIYSIKYNLIAKSAPYGFKNPLMACCGHGGPPYNYEPSLKCRDKGYDVCELGSRYISWDGVHYTEAANAIVAGEILTANYSTPSLGLNFFCNNA